MKAFRYITALGLGAAVSLELIASASVAQAGTAEAAESQGLVATSLVPGMLDEATAASPVEPESQVIEPPVQPPMPEPQMSDVNVTAQGADEVAQLTLNLVANGTKGDEPEELELASSPLSSVVEPVTGLISSGPTLLAQAPQPDGLAEAEVVPLETVPVEAAQVNTEPLEPVVEPAVETVPVEADSPDPIEQEFLNEPSTEPTVDDPVEMEPLTEVSSDVDVDQTGVVTSAPDGTGLIDDQPNLLRPDTTDTVEVDATLDIPLERAIEIARQNSPIIRVRQLQVDRSRATLRQAQAALSPQLSVGSDFQQSGFGRRTRSLYNEVDDVQAPEGDDAITRQHSTTLDADLTLNYNIIQPGRRAAIQAAEKQVEQAELQLNTDLSQLRLDVSSDYYAVQEADEQVNISQSAVDSALRSLQDAQALERAGVGTKFAVLQAEVQLANEEQNRINALSNQQRTRRVLSRRLSIPENFSVSSADTVQADSIWEPTLEQSIILAYRNRVELDNQLLAREIAEAQREQALAGTRPTVGLFATVGPQYSFTDQRSGSGDLVNARAGQRSRQFEYAIGVQFDWTFFDGGASKASARQQELDKAIAEEQFENVRDTVRQEVEDAFYQLQANFENITTAKKGVQQAVSALRLARLRFQAGVGTQSEVVDAERDLTTARGNEVNAILNYNRALVQMRRAVGETLEAPAYESPTYVEASNP